MIINQKVALCLDQPNLHVILCVGETLDEYENELLETVITMQVMKGLTNIKAEDVADCITISYEPIWAIGTGKVATPEQAQIPRLEQSLPTRPNDGRVDRQGRIVFGMRTVLVYIDLMNIWR